VVNKFFFFFCDTEWVQFDLDWHMGGSRPNAKDFVFVIPYLIVHNSSYIQRIFTLANPSVFWMADSAVVKHSGSS